MKQKFTFTIDRARWAVPNNAREETAFASELLVAHSLFPSQQGRMCCLGFYLQARGIPDAELANREAPCSVPAVTDSWLLNNSGSDNSAEAYALMGINDDPHLSPAVREEEVRRRFAAQNIEVLFEGDYVHGDSNNQS